MIEQLSDEVKRLENLCQGYDEDIGLLQDKIESYREILKTLLEITE
jgi:prefoldin subunit 5